MVLSEPGFIRIQTNQSIPPAARTQTRPSIGLQDVGPAPFVPSVSSHCRMIRGVINIAMINIGSQSNHTSHVPDREYARSLWGLKSILERHYETR